jgi:hypothetical protein
MKANADITARYAASTAADPKALLKVGHLSGLDLGSTHTIPAAWMAALPLFEHAALPKSFERIRARRATRETLMPDWTQRS